MSDLPEGWEWSTIGAVAQYIQRGKSPQYAPLSALPVINQKCIRWTELQLQHLKYIHPDQFGAWDESRHIKPGDILWNSTGTGTVGRAYLVKDADCTPKKVVDSHVTVVRSAAGFDPRYLFNWIKGPDVQGKIEEMCDGTTNQIELSRTAIAETAIPIAPAAEQTRIANQLDTLLTRIQSCNERFDAIPALLKRFRQTVCAATTTGPWEPSTIGAISADLRYGTSKKCDYAPAGTGVLRIPNIAEQGRIDATDLKRAEFDANELQKLALVEGDLLVIRSNGSVELVGKTGLVTANESGLLFAGYLMRLRVDRAKVIPAYVQIFLSAPLQRQYIERTAKSTSGVNNLNAEELRSLPLLLPPLSEQIELVRRARALFALADRIEAHARSARTQAQRLSPLVLAKAFRGELVVQDLQDEPASVLLERIAMTKPAEATASRGRTRTKTQGLFSTPEVVQPDGAGLPDGVWASPEAVDEHAVTAMLVAVLKAWGGTMPQTQARLAAVLCLQPRQMAAVLSAEQATQWQRLVGPAADPLPTQVVRLQPATDSAWRTALLGMRARGDLVEAGSGPQATWALGRGADQIETAGWPEGRAGWVVAYLRAHGVEAILPLLEPLIVEFVHAKAA